MAHLLFHLLAQDVDETWTATPDPAILSWDCCPFGKARSASAGSTGGHRENGANCARPRGRRDREAEGREIDVDRGFMQARQGGEETFAKPQTTTLCPVGSQELIQIRSSSFVAATKLMGAWCMIRSHLDATCCTPAEHGEQLRVAASIAE